MQKTRGLPRRDYNALNNGTFLLPEPREGKIREMESPARQHHLTMQEPKGRPYPCDLCIFPALRPLR